MEISLEGSFGAVIAKVFGHEQTSTLKEHATINISSLPFSQAELLFFVATFSMLAKLADVDGEISEAELSTVSRFAEKGLNLDKSQTNFSLRVFEAAHSLPLNFADFALEFSNLYENDKAMKLRMLETLVLVAYSDSELCKRELPILQEAASIFSLERSDLDALIRMHIVK